MGCGRVEGRGLTYALDIGAWLEINGEAIYGTTYFNHAEEPGSNVGVRYTARDGALYATALQQPGDQLTLGSDLAVDRTARITLLGSDGRPLDWRRDAAGRVVVDMPEEGVGATRSRHAYVFKISAPGVWTFLRSNLELPSEIAPGRTVPATLRVTNTGSVRSESASAVLSAPEGLSAEPSTVTVRSLKPGETMTIPVSLSVARDTPQGQHDLTLRFTQGRISTATPVPVSRWASPRPRRAPVGTPRHPVLSTTTQTAASGRAR